MLCQAWVASVLVAPLLSNISGYTALGIASRPLPRHQHVPRAQKPFGIFGGSLVHSVVKSFDRYPDFSIRPWAIHLVASQRFPAILHPRSPICVCLARCHLKKLRSL